MKILKELFKTEGRVSRLPYFIHFVLSNFMLLVFAYLYINNKYDFNEILMEIYTYFVIVIFIFIFVSEICITIRRLHDLNLSGLHYFKLLIPFYNIYFGLILFLYEGTPGANDYGENPLGIKGSVQNVVPATKEEKSKVPILFGIFIVILIGYLLYYDDLSQPEMQWDDQEPDHKISQDSIKIIFEDVDQNTESIYQSEIKFFEGYKGYIVSFDTSISIFNFEEKLWEFGFTKVETFYYGDGKLEFIKHLDYKNYATIEDTISIQIGINDTAIKYFLKHLKRNLIKNDVAISVDFPDNKEIVLEFFNVKK